MSRRTQAVVAILALVLLAGAACFAVAWRNERAIDEVGRAVQEDRGAVGAMAAKSADPAALAAIRSRMGVVVGTRGGLAPLGPDFLIERRVRERARDNETYALALLPVIAILSGDLDQAKKDCAAYRAFCSSGQGGVDLIEELYAEQFLRDPEERVPEGPPPLDAFRQKIATRMSR